MNVSSDTTLPVDEQADVGIVMPDGCRLSARIWMPSNAASEPVPAIIEHLPYRKRDGTIYRDELTHPYFAARGYACIRVDMRGNGESEGLMDDEYTPQELQDACDVIAWAKAQPWCSGKLGMMGISWGGFNALQVAAMQPAGLEAIVTVCSTVDRFADDIHYKGGCLLTENIGWTANMLSYSSRPPDPELVGDQWYDIWQQRLKHMPLLASTWLRHQSRDAYWQHGSVCEDYASIKAATLSIGGWHDGYRNTISHLVKNLSAPVKGIVGPWIHKYPHYAAPTPTIGFLQESLRWWDRWLKDKNTSVEDDADYRVWLMDSVKPARWLDHRPGCWIGEQQWPAESESVETFHFHGSDSGLSLTTHASRCEFSVKSPQHCGANCGEYFPFTFGPELPDEQSGDDALSVCIDSDKLGETHDIVGAPVVELRLSADKPNAQIAVRLCDLRPDGTSALITMGVLNLAHRHSFEKPEKLTPHEVYPVRVELDQIAYRLPAGHRLRIALSSSYWPFIWPSAEASTLTVVSGQLSLPIRADRPSGTVEFAEAETSDKWQAEELRAASAIRNVYKDDDTQEYITSIRNDFGEFKDLHHGLINGSVVTERWSIHPDNPLSAKGLIEWEQTGGREDWQWRTEACVQVHADVTHMHVNATLRAYNNDEVIFSQDYADKITREFF